MSEFDDYWGNSTFRHFQVYVGWDPREQEACKVAVQSLRSQLAKETPFLNANIYPLQLKRLELQGIMRRPTRRTNGQLWDEISDAPMSTEFAISRFAVPILAQRGFALFVDGDVVFLDGLRPMLREVAKQPDKAVWVVKHEKWNTLKAGDGTKMDGQMQTLYARKNWSSVMLFNCDHPKNLGLNLELINSRPGRDLHRFCWLDDHEIGTLPPEWNWLVGVQPKPKEPKIAHFTLGGPWLPNWKAQPYDDIWLGASQDC